VNVRARVSICSLLVLTVAIPSWASGPPGDNPMQEIIRRSFGTAEYAGFRIKTNGGNFLEVCGDSCAFFKWAGDANDDRFWRFIVLYEINDSPGTDVAAFMQMVRTTKTDLLLKGSPCTLKGDDISKLECNWDAYAKSLKIDGGHSRYDEGNRCFSTIIDWQSNKTSSKWKCSKAKPEESPFR